MTKKLERPPVGTVVRMLGTGGYTGEVVEPGNILHNMVRIRWGNSDDFEMIHLIDSEYEIATERVPGEWWPSDLAAEDKPEEKPEPISFLVNHDNVHDQFLRDFRNLARNTSRCQNLDRLDEAHTLLSTLNVLLANLDSTEKLGAIRTAVDEAAGLVAKAHNAIRGAQTEDQFVWIPGHGAWVRNRRNRLEDLKGDDTDVPNITA